MVNECSGMITVLPPAVTEPTLEACTWPSAGIPQGTDGVVAVSVRGGNTARSVTFNVKKAGAQCSVSASVYIPGDLAIHIYNVVVPAAACLGAQGTYSMSVQMIIEGVSLACTGAFLRGLNDAIGSRPGDANWNAIYDLDKDGLISNNDAALFRTTCPNVCDLAKFQAAWGSVIGDSNYDPVYDFNQDGVIDISDASIRVLVCPY